MCTTSINRLNMLPTLFSTQSSSNGFSDATPVSLADSFDRNLPCDSGSLSEDETSLTNLINFSEQSVFKVLKKDSPDNSTITDSELWKMVYSDKTTLTFDFPTNTHTSQPTKSKFYHYLTKYFYSNNDDDEEGEDDIECFDDAADSNIPLIDTQAPTYNAKSTLDQPEKDTSNSWLNMLKIPWKSFNSETSDEISNETLNSETKMIQMKRIKKSIFNPMDMASRETYTVKDSIETLPSIAARFKTTPTKLKVIKTLN